jgi:Ca2+-binding EF-hand superfamily protein
LRDEFSAADFDGNGTLDVDELNDLLKKMGYITDAAWSKVGHHGNT